MMTELVCRNKIVIRDQMTSFCLSQQSYELTSSSLTCLSYAHFRTDHLSLTNNQDRNIKSRAIS